MYDFLYILLVSPKICQPIAHNFVPAGRAGIDGAAALDWLSRCPLKTAPSSMDGQGGNK
jgi:hypothetical protein